MQQTLLTDALGYVAAGLVFATFCAQRMALLRALAIVSNVAFIGYGFLDGLWPILILHSAMLPINVRRYRQSVRGHRNQGVSENVTSARTDGLDPFYTGPAEPNERMSVSVYPSDASRWDRKGLLLGSISAK